MLCNTTPTTTVITAHRHTKKQLESPELQSIHPMIAGELKATEGIINEFKAAFELDEFAGEMVEE